MYLGPSPLFAYKTMAPTTASMPHKTVVNALLLESWLDDGAPPRWRTAVPLPSVVPVKVTVDMDAGGLRLGVAYEELPLALGVVTYGVRL